MDFLGIDAMLNEEELEVRDKVRTFVGERIKPSVARWWEDAHFPREIAPEMGAMGILALHLGRMKDAETLRPEQLSVSKLNNVRGAIGIAHEARTILGGNGVTFDYPVMRHMNNLESVRTYEGTDVVHTLIIGNAITGIPAFR